MLDWLLGGRGIDDFIARKEYDKAIEFAKGALQKDPNDKWMRLRMADAYALSGDQKSALKILQDLADEYARGGFVAKAIALLKKIQKLDPSASDIEEKLANLVANSQTETMAQRLKRMQRVEALKSPVKPAAAPAPAPAPSASAPPPPRPAPVASAPPPPPRVEEVVEVVEVILDETMPSVGSKSGAPAPAPTGAAQSPLFSDFDHDELIAVMRGLELLSVEPGEILVSEGEPGDSLFVLVEGSVRVYVRDAARKNRQIRTMAEGAFFGEISVLAGKDRTATITAATRCELLELDRAALDSITEKHPRVRTVLEDFYEQRAHSAEEASVRQMKK